MSKSVHAIIFGSAWKTNITMLDTRLRQVTGAETWQNCTNEICKVILPQCIFVSQCKRA